MEHCKEVCRFFFFSNLCLLGVGSLGMSALLRNAQLHTHTHTHTHTATLTHNDTWELSSTSAHTRSFRANEQTHRRGWGFLSGFSPLHLYFYLPKLAQEVGLGILPVTRRLLLSPTAA